MTDLGSSKLLPVRFTFATFASFTAVHPPFRMVVFKEFTMRTRFVALLGVLLSLFCSCKPPEPANGDDPEGEARSTTSRLYVLCEGLYGMNNSTLYSREMQTGESKRDVFREKNARGLGDTGNDMGIYGSKLYIVMNGSNLIEVTDARTALSLKQIPLVDAQGIGRQPRYIAFSDGKAYVCNFDNTVCRIDTATLEVEAVTEVGRDPDGICVCGDYLFVSNSGGLDFPDCDNTVSVVDLASFKEIKKIKVGRNPYTIETDAQGFVYVCTRGDYEGFNQKSVQGGFSARGDFKEKGLAGGAGLGSEKLKRAAKESKSEGYNFYRIDPGSLSVDHVFDIPVLSFCIAGDTAYLYHYDYNTSQSWIRVMDLRTQTLLPGEFITDGTKVQTPYAIAYDPNMDRIYIGDAYNYMISGSVYCFSREGRQQFALHNVGLNPSSFAFLATVDSIGS